MKTAEKSRDLILINEEGAGKKIQVPDLQSQHPRVRGRRITTTWEQPGLNSKF